MCVSPAKVIAFAVSGKHVTCSSPFKPLNPGLGETYEGVLPGGSCVFCEQVSSRGRPSFTPQVSHHPPVSSFLVEDKNGKWKLFGSLHSLSFS